MKLYLMLASAISLKRTLSTYLSEDCTTTLSNQNGSPRPRHFNFENFLFITVFDFNKTAQECRDQILMGDGIRSNGIKIVDFAGLPLQRLLT